MKIFFKKKGRKEKKNKFDLIIRDYRFLPDGLAPGRVFSGLGLTEAHWQNYMAAFQTFNFTNTHTLL